VRNIESKGLAVTAHRVFVAGQPFRFNRKNYWAMRDIDYMAHIKE